MVVSTNHVLSSKDPPWKDDVGLALKRGQRTTARYLSLATLGSGSPDAPDPLAPVPRVRTVVFRGWLWSTTCALTFITDSRSDKMAHMGACEACWYFEKQREQFRITGTLQAVGGAEEDAKLLKARAAAWRQLNGEAREQFYAPAPGRPLGDTPAYGSSADSHLDDDDPADTFGLLILWPTQVDQLRLARRQHGGERSPQRRNGVPSPPDEPFDAIRNAIAERFETTDVRGVNSEPPPAAWRFRLASICSQPDEVDQLIQVHRAYVERMYRMDASDSAALLSAACRASHWDAALAILEGHRKLQLFDIDAHQLDWVVQGLGAAKQQGHLERLRALVPALLESAEEVSSAHSGIDALLADMASSTVVEDPGMEPGDGEPVGDGASASAEASEK